MNRKARRAAASKQASEQPSNIFTEPSQSDITARVEALWAKGVAHHQQGEIDQAVPIYKEILNIFPGHPGPWHHLGIVATSNMQFDTAIELIRKAVELNPEYAEAWSSLGTTYKRMERYDEALECYRKAIDIKPEFPEGHSNLGTALHDTNRLNEAIIAYKKAIEQRPEYPEALSNLAMVYQEKGMYDEALEHYKMALRIKPNFSNALANLATLLHSHNQHEEAERFFRDALHIDPNNTTALSNIGVTLRHVGKLAEGEAFLQRALDINPNDAAALSNLAMIIQDKGDFKQAVEYYKCALDAKPTLYRAHSNMVFCSNYDSALSNQELLDTHLTWDEQHGKPRSNYFTNMEIDYNAERLLRIGFVSPDLYRHPVGYFSLPYFIHHDRDAFELHVYSDRIIEDEISELIQEHTNHWNKTSGLSMEELADRIHLDEIDILIDLTGHTGDNRLPTFAMKPSPIQLSWLGYFHTTGLSAMDYILMDDNTTPAGEEEWFAEKLLRLPQTRFCYHPPDYDLDVSPSPCEKNGYITFGSFNNLTKLTPEVIELWSQLLHEIADSKLLVKWRTLKNQEEQDRLYALFATHDIPKARLILRDYSQHPDCMAEYADVDIALDPFPYCGGLTSAEALWMGVPVITLPSFRPVSRQTYSFLQTMGLTELIANSTEEYIGVAKRLADDQTELNTIRMGMRERMQSSLMCDGEAFAHNMDNILRDIWKQACDRQRAKAALLNPLDSLIPS